MVIFFLLIFFLLHTHNIQFLAINQIYANRLIDPLERDVQRQIFIEEYCKLVDRLRDNALEIFKKLEDGMTWKQYLE